MNPVGVTELIVKKQQSKAITAFFNIKITLLAERRHRIIAFLLAMLFIGFYAGNNLCTHVHYVDNVMIVHSHPFSGSGHSHSSAALQAISLLNSAVFCCPAEIVAIAAQFILIAVVCIGTYRSVALRCLSAISLRAPPVY